MKYIKDFLYNFNDLIFSLIVLVGVVLVLYLNMNYMSNVELVNQQTQNSAQVSEETSVEMTISVNVPTSTSLSQLGTLLESYGIITDTNVFIESFEDQSVQPHPGTYELKQNMSFDEIKSIIIFE